MRKVAGVFCTFEEDGSSFVLGADRGTKLDRNSKVMWAVKTGFSHHMLTKSGLTGNYLFLDSAFKNQGPALYRSDVLRVIDSSGRSIKTVNFKKILAQFKSFNYPVRPAAKADWFKQYLGNKEELNFEDSHVNSFYEMTSGNAVTGYVVNCKFQKKIIFLDETLQKVTRIIDVGTRSLHNVHPVSAQKLLLYQNHPDVNTTPRYSSIEELDLTSEKFTQIYSANSSEFSANCGGSVQNLGPGRYLLFHGNSTPTADSVAMPVIELIDLNRKSKAVLKMEEKWNLLSAEVFDAEPYLKNSPGI